MIETSPPSILPPSALPEVLPILPLPGMLLLPRGRLPLNIFEPRYIDLIEDALGQGRLIGIIQPTMPEDKTPVPSLYRVGCAGRIVSFSETDDGRFLINLHGVCRFSVEDELPLLRGYRRVKPGWQSYLGDVGPAEEAIFDRARLMNAMRHYFKANGIAADWGAVQDTTGEMLVSSLAMICPLEPSEKQALVEAPDLATRAKLLTTLLEMACLPQQDIDSAKH